MGELAEAMRQELPDVSDTRAEFMIDGVPYVFTTEEDNPSIFVYAVIGALPQDESERSQIFAMLLHAQFCFSESCGFSFGVDADNSFVLLQALVDTNRFDEASFVALMDKFVKAANVWHSRLAEAEFGSTDESDEPPAQEAGIFV